MRKVKLYKRIKSKAVAICLSVAMAVTAFTGGTPGLATIHAEEATQGNYLSFVLPTVLGSSSVEQIGVGAGSCFAFTVNGTVRNYLGVDGYNAKIAVADGGEAPYTVLGATPGSQVEYKLVRYSASEPVADYIFEGDMQALEDEGKVVLDSIVGDVATDKFVVYARPVFDEAATAAVIDRMKADDPSVTDSMYNYDMCVPYSIQMTYQYASGVESLFGWYNGGLLDTSSLQYVENATLGPDSSNGLVPTMKYQILPISGSDVPAAVDGAWNDTASLTEFEDGKYVGYVACVLENGTVVKQSNPFVIGKDAEAPTYVAELCEVDASNNVVSVLETMVDDGNVQQTISVPDNLGANANRQLALRLLVEDKGIGLSSVEYSVAGGASGTSSSNEIVIPVNKNQITTVSLKLTDKMATPRVAERTIKVVNDIIAPVIAGISIDGDSYDAANIKRVNDFNLVAGPITDKGGAGVALTSGKVSFYKNNDLSAEPEVVCSGLALSGDANNASLAFNLKENIGDTVLQGNYSIVVTATDSVNNEAKVVWENIYIDTSVPACDAIAIYYRDKSQGGDWKVYSAYEYDRVTGSFGDSNIIVNPYGYYEYMYEITDEDGDIASISVEDSCGACGEETKTSVLDSATGFEELLYSSDADYIKDHNNRKLKLTFKNKVGSTKEVNLPYVLASDELNVEGCKIMDKDGTVVNELPAITNQQYTFDVNVTSSHKINSISIIVENDKGEKVDYGTTVNTSSQCKFSVASGTFELNEIALKIPTNIDKNSLINKAYVEVVEDNYDVYGNPIVKRIDLGTLLYDMSKPTLKSINYILNQDPSIKFDPNKWYKSASAVYTIEAGNFVGDNLESKLVSVECDVDSGTTVRNIVQKYSGLTDTYTGSINNIDPSEFVSGTKLLFYASDEASNTMGVVEKVVKIDSKKPVISDLTIANSNEANLYNGIPSISALIKDNLSLDRLDITVKYPDNEVISFPIGITDGEKENIEKSLTIPDFSMKKPIIDGNYTVVINAKDKAGNDCTETVKFAVDRTLPVVNAKISGGVVGGKSPMANYDGTSRDMYYQSDVAVELSLLDRNADINNITVTDNGRPVSVNWNYDNTSKKYLASYIATEEGIHTINIVATDSAGNTAKEKTITFVKDTIAPVVSTSIANNYILSDTGMLYFTSDVVVATGVSDANVDADDFYYSVERRLANVTPNSGFEKTSNSAFTFSEEAEYVVNFYCVDKAGNRSETRNVNFRIDKTAPELAINGVEDGGKMAGAIVVTLSMTETFYSDATGKATIYKKTGDGISEITVKSIDLTPSSVVTAINEAFNETGEYRIEMEATDKVGHRSTLIKKFIVDTKAPEIKLTGVKNFDKTSSPVSIYSEITDDFYLGKTVSVTGSRIDIDGQKHILDLGGYSSAANPTVIDQKFEDDGIYDIDITATDSVGNSTVTKVHFTIDKTEPIIGDLPIKDGDYVNSIDLGFDVEQIVKDLTVCNVSMYLNGSEYDGFDELEDGVYKLLITAEDELGHKAEKTISFVYDTKAPLFAVEGVADGDVRDEAFSIKVGVQDDDDVLEAVTLDGVSLDVKNNTVSLDVNEKGEHKLSMKAKDKAGNEAEQTITFKYSEKTIVDMGKDVVKKSGGFPIVIVSIFALLIGGIIILLLKRRKENKY